MSQFPHLKDKNILVVDDRFDTVEYLLMSLKNHGAKPVWNSTLQEALEYLSSDEPVDFIIIDLNMPGEMPTVLNGYLTETNSSLYQGSALGRYIYDKHAALAPRRLYYSAYGQAFTSASPKDNTIDVVTKGQDISAVLEKINNNI